MQWRCTCCRSLLTGRSTTPLSTAYLWIECVRWTSQETLTSGASTSSRWDSWTCCGTNHNRGFLFAYLNNVTQYFNVMMSNYKICLSQWTLVWFYSFVWSFQGGMEQFPDYEVCFFVNFSIFQETVQPKTCIFFWPAFQNEWCASIYSGSFRTTTQVSTCQWVNCPIQLQYWTWWRWSNVSFWIWL